MQEADPGVRRVAVCSGTTVVDVALPAAVPVGALIPSILDIVRSDGVDERDSGARRHRLSRVEGPALDPSTTLAHNDVHDGTMLVLSQYATPPPAVRHDDMAEAVSAALEGRSPVPQRGAIRLTAALAAGCLTGFGALALTREGLNGNVGTSCGVAATGGVIALLSAAIAHRTYREPIAGLTLGAMAVVFAAVAGFVVVPGSPGLPNAMLAAAAASATSVVAMRVSGCGAVTFTAIAAASLVVAVAAFGGTVTAAPPRAVAAVSTLVAIALIGAAARASITLAGLSPRLPPAECDDTEPDPARLAAAATRADDWLTCLLAALASSAAIGAAVAVLAGPPRRCCIGFGALTAALLLMRSRSYDGRRALVFGVSGVVILGVTVGGVARTATHGPWIPAAAALLAVATIFLGFVAPRSSLSQNARRSVELVEYLAALALVPLACWVSGLYAAIRGTTLG